MKQKTAIRQLIEKIEAHQSAITESVSDANRARFGAYARILIEAMALEPVNEQQIIDAWESGNHSEMRAGRFQREKSTKYFNETFEKP